MEMGCSSTGGWHRGAVLVCGFCCCRSWGRGASPHRAAGSIPRWVSARCSPPPAWDTGRSPQSHRHPVCFSSHGELSASLLLPAGGTQDDPSGSIPLLFPHGNPHSWRWLPSPPLTSEITARGGGVGGGSPAPQLCGAAAQLAAGKLCFRGSCAPLAQGLCACR